MLGVRVIIEIVGFMDVAEMGEDVDDASLVVLRRVYGKKEV